MSIEFSCSQCGQNLRVSEEAAGKKAKCPKCSHVNLIPAPTSAFDGGLGDLDDSEYKLLPEAPQKGTDPSPFGPSPSQANPYASPQTGYGPTTTTSTGRRGIHNVRADIGTILNYAFAVWQRNLGVLIGATVVVGAISMAFSFGQSAIAEAMRMADQPELALVVELIGAFVNNAVQLYLGIGVAQLMLSLARNQRADFSDIFNGGPRFLPVLGVAILFGLALMGGFMLLIIPGIIVALMWWPCYYLVVDNKAGVIESFGVARQITEGNMGTTFLMWLVGIGITLIGLLACCVGLIFAAPLVGMIYIVAYLMMSGQIPLQPGTTASKSVF